MEFYEGKDYSQMLYTLHVIGGVRSGSELVLAYFSSLFGLDPLSIFMALLVCLQTILILATLSFVPQKHRTNTRYLSLFTLVAMFNGLLTFSFVVQLIAQICGLILLISILKLSHRFESGKSVSIFLVGVLFAAQLIFYPELIPFLILALILVLIAKRKNASWKSILNYIFSTLLVCLIALNSQMVSIAKFLFYQIDSGGSSGIGDDFVLFPYFLRITGFSYLFGIWPLDVPLSGMLAVLTTLLGIVCMFLLLTLLFKARKELDELSCMVIVFLLVFVLLYLRQSDFGTFKIALYSNPFFVTFLSIKLLNKINVNAFPIRSQRPVVFLSVIVILANAINQIGYIATSTGVVSNRGLVELHNSSKNGLVTALNRTRDKYRPEMGTLISTTTSPLIAKLMMIKFRGIPIVFPSMNFVNNFTGILLDDPEASSSTFGQLPKAKLPKLPKATIAYEETNIAFPNRNVETKLSEYLAQKPQYFLNYRDEINFSQKRHNGNSEEELFEISKSPTRNLLFTNSKLGNLYFMSLEDVALHRPENHPILEKVTMFAGGNNFLFQVFGQHKYGTLTLDLDSTLLPQNNRRIPPFTVYGQKSKRVNQYNYGQARITIENFLPLIDEKGRQFIYISFDGIPKRFPERDGYLFRKLNRNIPADGRRVLIHILGIRFEEKEKIDVRSDPYLPLSLSQNLNALSFGGIYSDSWTYSDFNLTLEKRADVKKVILEFEVNNPEGSKVTRNLKILVDDVLLKEEKVISGVKKISIPMNKDRIKIQVVTSPQSISQSDARISGVKIIRVDGA
jgi:hypothetical protein